MDRPDLALTAASDLETTQDCTYRNTSDRMVIFRCCGSDQFFLERVVFPFEILAFSCPPMSEIKVWSHGLYGPELLESFFSEQLLVDRPSMDTEAHQEGMFPASSTALQTTPWLRAS